jgi:hypothetical protein
MPTVDVGDTLGILTPHWTRRLRSVGWTTFVDNELNAQCEPDRHGPVDRLDVWTLSGGAMGVRLRDEPADDDAFEAELQGYMQADTLVRQVRASDGVAFLPPWTADTSREWLNRWQPGGAASVFLS